MRRTVFALVCCALTADLAIGCGRTHVAVDDDGGTTPPPDADVGCTADIHCDDGLFCNGRERCVMGRCVASTPPSCDDGVSCTIDVCDSRTDRCRSMPDSSRCFEGQICDAMRGCVTRSCTNDRECDDGLFCNGREVCRDGTCQPTDPPSCDDGIDCTEDLCDDASGGCFSVPRDRDRDGFGDAACGGMDCDDFEVRIFPGAPEDCESGLDENCDGLIDCEDPGCAMTPACTCLPREECGAGIDADCDGFVDCDDPDCRGTPACTRPCATRDLGSRTGMRVATGNTSDGMNEITPSCAASRAPEHIYRWTPPASGIWTIDTFGSRYDTMLVVLRTCAGPELACNDDTPGFGTASRVSVSLRAGEAVLIVVDGWATSAGDYVLNIQMGGGREICDNMLDDDGDGLIDCADIDCASTPACCRPRPEVCTNRVDDDCDGLVDCADPDCRASPACCRPTTEICTDGRDQDCDGLIDCADPDCASHLACCIATPEICTDGRDQDCDGLVDCADPDCATHSSCCVPSPEVCDNMRDDDCDGLVDCADPVCASAPACCRPVPEICDNARDDDCDRQVDCADPDCATHSSCCVPSPEVCDNMRDDDCDGRSDCSDPECALSPSCCVPSPEVCDNMRDDDCDGRSDCSDADCAAAPICVPCPDADLGSRLGLRVAAGTTSGAPNRFAPSCAMSRAGDRAFTWTAPVTSDFLFDTFGSTFDTVLAVRAGCTGPELPGACNDDVPALGTLRSRVRLTLTAGTRVLVVVDGKGTASGSFVLNITRVVADETGLCTDRLDNDGDFLFDCMDPDCAMDTACVR
jgi:hypothetical protein